MPVCVLVNFQSELETAYFQAPFYQKQLIVFAFRQIRTTFERPSEVTAIYDTIGMDYGDCLKGFYILCF